jgi:putative transposase
MVQAKAAGYWKDGDSYKSIVLMRNDRHVVGETEQTIYIKDFKLSLKFKGRLKWRGKQGRLEVRYNDARRAWYAYIPVEVENNVKAEGGLRASVDLSIVNLATVYVEDGTWYLFKGGGVLARYEHYSKKMASTQKLLARHGQRSSRRLRPLYEKGSRFLKHALTAWLEKLWRS